MILPRSLVVVDVETTGLNPHECALLSIGAVRLDGAGPLEWYGECAVRAGARIEPKALEVNGATPDRLARTSLPSESELVERFFGWCVDHQLRLLAGMNPAFDLGWLRASHERLKDKPRRWFPFAHRTIDLHTLAVAYAMLGEDLVPATGYGTDAIYELLDLPPEPRPHNALIGARREAEALRLLLAKLDLYGTTP